MGRNVPPKRGIVAGSGMRIFMPSFSRAPRENKDAALNRALDQSRDPVRLAGEADDFVVLARLHIEVLAQGDDHLAVISGSGLPSPSVLPLRSSTRLMSGVVVNVHCRPKILPRENQRRAFEHRSNRCRGSA